MVEGLKLDEYFFDALSMVECCNSRLCCELKAAPVFMSVQYMMEEYIYLSAGHHIWRDIWIDLCETRARRPRTPNYNVHEDQIPNRRLALCYLPAVDYL